MVKPNMFFSGNGQAARKASPALPTVKIRGGTTHAVLLLKDVVKEPFAVINADDYYEQDRIFYMADFL